MNYRHAFHAGNFADVMKHAVLALVIASLKRKDTPFFALDTHAGIGAYDLEAPQADKTGEYLNGIARVLDADQPPADLEPYLAVVRGWNSGGSLRRYPGSPELVRGLMRPQDRMALVELHPEDVETLRARFHGDRRVGVHHLDGYTAAKGLLPPLERRGLVLMDPPFEVKNEFDRLLAALRRTRKLWPTGIILAWYPIKGREPVDGFLQAVADDGGPESLAAELLLRPAQDPFKLNGSGLLIINPPWQLRESLERLLPWLASIMAPATGFSTVRQVIAEKTLG
ncbi:Protein involved in catabolism of external DNA [Paramagnetospirillum magnetotacticum MS-1]|uniref:Ribosomal RNA large subunit methyltransferase J n=1 Tax=Paramagnetospirillum magnetotacticum MS-1 TaxID=272627 RepID=A0A0C2YQC8_PARME|nr:23S rRNA (adenine(2030)-N(6))-methyltransferase RlmJ [Paramagnetospirillum magnetotacticum]KIL97318.1 Protein involved in catabolism of external DNA [Paramagnetospirillum magnetotacticum MS-1]